MKRQAIKNSTILVVGGAGFIGSHLVDQLITSGADKVIIMDNLFIGQKENVKDAIDKGALFYVDDAENEEALAHIIEKHGITIVFNCATKPLNYSFINPANTFLTNVHVLKNLLELQRKNVYDTLCHFSSSEAYGSSIYEPMDEAHPLNPLTTYAAGKAAADLLLHSYVNLFDLDAFIVRPFNNYGPRQNFAGEMAGVVPLTIKKIAEAAPPEIHGDGMQTRDYIYVQDTTKIVLKVYPVIAAGECVNITTDQQISIKTVIETIAKEMKYTGSILNKPARKADVQSHLGSTKRLVNMIGDIQRTPFREGINRTVNWFMETKDSE